MGKLLNNEHLNYWVCGLIFVIVYPIVLWLLNMLVGLAGGVAAILGVVLYIVVMPYLSGRLVDWISDKWMD